MPKKRRKREHEEWVRHHMPDKIDPKGFEPKVEKPAPKAEPEPEGETLDAPTSNDVGEQTETKASLAEKEGE